MRRSIVVGNWKMNGSVASIESLLSGLTKQLQQSSVEVVVCPSYVHIAQVLKACTDSVIEVGGQDCSHVSAGAYTGEVAAGMLRDLGCQWVVLGHSERRQYHRETSAIIAAKLEAAIEAGLRPILCVGETREERESGEAQTIVAAQIDGVLQAQGSLSGLVVAYEPVWAIGTGLTASPEQAQEMHAFIRKCLADVSGLDANETSLLYGGSVKGANAAELFSQADIDGALVGGAALDAQEFLAIISAAA